MIKFIKHKVADSSSTSDDAVADSRVASTWLVLYCSYGWEAIVAVVVPCRARIQYHTQKRTFLYDNLFTCCNGTPSNDGQNDADAGDD